MATRRQPSICEILIVLFFVLAAAQAADAHTFKVLYNFTGGADGTGPVAGLTMDKAGNLYGTAAGNHLYDYGSVYKVAPSNGSWSFGTIYTFNGGSDGGDPWCSVILDANGNVYGTATIGGSYGYGVVWEITP